VTTISRELAGPSASQVGYHLRVLANDCSLIELVRSPQAPDAAERFYRLNAGTILADLQLLQQEDAGNDPTFAARPVTVDAQGMAEINRALREAMKKVERAEAESRGRLRSKPSNGVGAVVGAAAFHTAHTRTGGC
jgi:uncharacterized protein (DUF3084 family)